ncbi:MAG: acyl carrier protein [Alphaproteobacteria bacterium]|nr:acyl carrier protein [Alphaproteobacteria bacterium]
MSIEKKVKDILIERFAVVPDDNKTLVGDLNLDSLEMVELYMELEQTFKIHIPDDMSSQISSMTVADLIKYVECATSGNTYIPKQRNLVINTAPETEITPAKQTPAQKIFTGLYTITNNGKVKCGLTDRPCKKITPDEITKNTKLLNLCRNHKCIIERNFQKIMQEHTK